METEENELSLEFDITGTSRKMSVPVDRNNLKVRRRNVAETTNLPTKDDKNSDFKDRVPLVQLSDSTRAWYDDVIPRIPNTADFGSPGKQNGVLNYEGDSNVSDDRVGGTEMHSNRERMKISVIRGSIVNPDLTLGELRLLGCSSEGLVNDDIRRILWPKLLRLSEEDSLPIYGLENIHSRIPDEVYQQILKDVARSGSHISPNATQQEMDHFHKELTQLICWVLHRHSTLKDTTT